MVYCPHGKDYREILNSAAVDLEKDGACAGDLVHDEAFAGEQAGTELLLEIDVKFHALVHGKEGTLLYNDGIAGHIDLADLTG